MINKGLNDKDKARQEYLKQWKKNNPEKVKQHNKQSYKNWYPKHGLEYSRKYHQLHKEQLNAMYRAYYLKNKDKILEVGRQWSLKNRERIREQKRNYYLKNRERILKQRKKLRDKKTRQKVSKS
jgi:hypothetical protein